MSKLVLIFTIIISLSTMTSGCSYFSVYKIDIQQGNVVTQEMIDQLWPGMTKNQVLYVMGTPLIHDTFHENRWDYLYSMQAAKGESKVEQISLFFTEEQLVGLKGDFHPTDYVPLVPEPEEIVEEKTPESTVIDWNF